MTTAGVPHVVTLVGVDPHEPTVRFDTALSQDHIISSGARTSDSALRTGAVAGVNGDYFDIGRTYEPQGMLIGRAAAARADRSRSGRVRSRTTSRRSTSSA